MTATRRVSEETIEDAAGEELLRVRVLKTQVKIIWHCGDEFPFKWQRLRDGMSYIEQFANRDVWVALTTSSGDEFMALLDGDHLRVRANGREEPELPWTQLKALLDDALAEGAKYEAEQVKAAPTG